MFTRFLLCLSAASAAEVSRTSSGISPVKKVIGMMQSMLDKCKNEKKEEQVQYAAYVQFCSEEETKINYRIGKDSETIKFLEADIDGHHSKSQTLTQVIAKHDENIAVWTGDIRAATKVRQIEKEDYEKTHADYTESIDALGRAIEVLKKQRYDRPQSFVQLSALKSRGILDDDSQRMIDSFLSSSESEDEAAVAAPEAEGYEFQSDGVIEMLEKLQDKFQGELRKLEKEEIRSQQAFEVLVQDLDAEIGYAKKDRDECAATKAKRLEMKAEAFGDKEDTQETKEADKKYLADLKATCAQKASDFEARQELRSEEIKAIEKAMEIISSEAVSGSAEKHLPTLVQAESSSFALVNIGKMDTTATARAKLHTATYLRSRAEELSSKLLSMAAIRASADPFGKVKKMIKDLIAKLIEEANEEAEHKGWCDQELATNKRTRKEKTEAIESLAAEKDLLEASMSKLTEDMASLAKAIKDIDAAMAEATELRQKEKPKNEETVKDAKEGEAAVQSAIAVLKDFYEKAGEATVLVQKSDATPPELFDGPYKGQQAENGGIIGMLDVIQSDFARLEAETMSAEASSQQEYKAFMEDSKADKADKQTEIEKKTFKKQDKSQALTLKVEDLDGTQKELDAALDYYDKLKPTCVDAAVSYDDRVARRKDEIESLREALKIMQGEDIA